MVMDAVSPSGLGGQQQNWKIAYLQCMFWNVDILYHIYNI